MGLILVTIRLHHIYHPHNSTQKVLHYSPLQKPLHFRLFQSPPSGVSAAQAEPRGWLHLLQFTVLRCFLPLQVSIQTFTQNLLFQKRPNPTPNYTKLNPTLIIIRSQKQFWCVFSICKFSLLIPMFRQQRPQCSCLQKNIEVYDMLPGKP